MRPDTLAAAIDTGELPALARLRAEGRMHTVTSVFPSVTGPAYTPLLMGRFPGDVGLPGLRWFDRTHECGSFPDFTRSYVGQGIRYIDGDCRSDAPTLFELVPGSLAATSMVSRGLARGAHVGVSLADMLRGTFTHFTGDVRGWLAIDRDVAARLARAVRERRPRFVFAAMLGVDKASHAEGQAGPSVRAALRIVDAAAAELRADAERDGRWPTMQLWVASDHGHSPVRFHEDLAGLVESSGSRVLSHPWVYDPRPHDVAVMVSGNAMAHLYVELKSRARPWWPALAGRWEPLAAQLLERDSVDLLLLPHSADRCEVRGRGRGTALVERDGRGRLDYRPLSGDPLGLGGELAGLDARGAYDVCLTSDYPDALVQIAHLAGSARAGQLILSAARDWDFRARYEPIPHRSSHGALHRDHMLVPLLVNHPVAGAPRRTADVMPSVLRALGLPVPSGLDGESFV